MGLAFDALVTGNTKLLQLQTATGNQKQDGLIVAKSGDSIVNC